jgi:hypothetical protein
MNQTEEIQRLANVLTTLASTISEIIINRLPPIPAQDTKSTNIIPSAQTKHGQPLVEAGTIQVSLAEQVNACLAICGHGPQAETTTVFSGVKVEVPNSAESRKSLKKQNQTGLISECLGSFIASLALPNSSANSLAQHPCVFDHRQKSSRQLIRIY